MSIPTPRTPQPDEIDLRQVFQTLRRYAGVVACTTALAAGGTYWISKTQAPTYEATASVIAVDNDGRNNLINNTLVTAPPLPQGAVEGALHSKRVVTDVIRNLQRSDLPPALIGTIRTDLTNELADNTFGRFKVKARLDPQQRGVYEIRASAETPEAARQLAQLGVNALLAWDTARAQEGVTRARRSLQEQLDSLTRRLQTLPEGSLERQSLIAARGQVLQNLSQVAVFETAASGTLSLIAEPVAPRRPVSPKPLRNAALAGLLALFLAAGGALLTDSLRRRVNGAEDVLGLGLPILGSLPMLPRKQLKRGFVSASQSGHLHESLGFLRINVQTLLHAGGTKRFVVSSAYPGEGKSSVTAALAASLADSGLRVLVLDADLRRPTQFKVWAPTHPDLVPLPGSLPNLAPAATFGAAFQNPDAAHAVRVAPNVDLLPAGTGGKGAATASILNQSALPALLSRWTSGYDVVLIDSPPMLSLPDTLAIARFTDGVLLVVEAGKTRMADVERSLENARTAHIPVLGFALNKLPRTRSAYAGYYSDNISVPSVLR